jgi:hypothetical protein
MLNRITFSENGPRLRHEELQISTAGGVFLLGFSMNTANQLTHVITVS